MKVHLIIIIFCLFNVIYSKNVNKTVEEIKEISQDAPEVLSSPATEEVIFNVYEEVLPVYSNPFHHKMTNHYGEFSKKMSDNLHGILDSIQVQQRLAITSIYNSTAEKFNSDEIFVDLGGGDCINAEKLAIAIRSNVWCVEPAVEVDRYQLPHVEYLNLDALSFSNLATVRYNFALMKEVIHHFSVDEYAKLFGNIYNQLLHDGTLLIMTRPKSVPYLYSKLFRDRWALASVKVEEEIVPKLNQAGFQVTTQTYNFSTVMQKEEWKSFIQDRTWSIFSTFSDDDIQKEFVELDKVYPSSSFNFTDNMIFVVAHKL